MSCPVVRIHSQLPFIRRELLCQHFSPRNGEKWIHNLVLNFSFNTKVDQIASMNVPPQYSITHYLANSSCNNSCLINRQCERKLRMQTPLKPFFSTLCASLPRNAPPKDVNALTFFGLITVSGQTKTSKNVASLSGYTTTWTMCMVLVGIAFSWVLRLNIILLI